MALKGPSGGLHYSSGLYGRLALMYPSNILYHFGEQKSIPNWRAGRVDRWLESSLKHPHPLRHDRR
jgi:hypothetical protein